MCTALRQYSNSDSLLTTFVLLTAIHLSVISMLLMIQVKLTYVSRQWCYVQCEVTSLEELQLLQQKLLNQTARI